MTYKVYTNYGYTDENARYKTDNLADALQWAWDFTYHGGDTAGCLMVEVGYHSPDGEYHIVKRYDIDEDDD